MKLFFSPTSPYVRKVLACAVELGLDGRIMRVQAAAHPVDRDQQVVAHNPIGKVPTLQTDDGLVLYDSRVICEYLDALAGGGRLFPTGAARWPALRDQALADGMLDAAVLIRYEHTLRAEPARSAQWLRGQHEKIQSGLATIEAGLVDGDIDAARVDVGMVAIGCALGYLDLRYPDLAWQQHYPRAAEWFAAFDARPSMVQTRPPQ